MTTPYLAPFFNHLWQSTLFAAAVGLLALALRRNRAQIRHALWLIASLKFLVPFSLLIAIGGHLEWPVAAVAARPAVSAAIHQIGQPLLVADLFNSVSGKTATSAHTGAPILFLIWLAGFLAVLASWLTRWMRMRVALRDAVPLPFVAPIKILSSSSLLEPGVFGIFKPVLVLPDGITGHLTADQLDAILAHELCHVRRRDNLAAAIHMLVEALFWFHPLVWWIGARLIEERERACDEEVLRLGNQPNVYAESILKTCQFYLEWPLACVSGITGSDLKKRMVRIMSEGLAVRLSFRKKLLLACAGIVALVVPLAVGLTNASQANNTGAPSFEAASIKPSKPGPGFFRIGLEPGGRFVANGINASTLLQLAYNVKESQISGAPSWFDSDRFDIQAKPDDTAAAEFQKLTPEQRSEQSRQMLQSLLADRFKLKLGHETRDLSVYFLEVAKNGPKFHESAVPNQPTGADGPQHRRGIMMNGRGQLTITDAKLDMFANVLSHQLGRIVLDKTGLHGKYDFTLHWTPEPGEGHMMPGGPEPGSEGPGGAPPPPPEASGPSLFTALQEQLGLKLESQKAPMDILVIEHVEKPSEN